VKKRQIFALDRKNIIEHYKRGSSFKQRARLLTLSLSLFSLSRATQKMSEEREEEEEEQPAPTRSARVPVPNSKFKVDDEEEDEEEEVKIERKPRTKVNHSKAGKQAKIKSSQLRAKKSFENLVNNNNDENEEEEPAATTRLVQPSKILIPQDGQQPKKWRLADQRRYECKQFCVHVFKCDHVGNSSRISLSVCVFSLFKTTTTTTTTRKNSLSLCRPRRDAFFLSFFLSFSL